MTENKALSSVFGISNLIGGLQAPANLIGRLQAPANLIAGLQAPETDTV
jgi:hypothetical protein